MLRSWCQELLTVKDPAPGLCTSVPVLGESASPERRVSFQILSRASIRFQTWDHRKLPEVSNSSSGTSRETVCWPVIFVTTSWHLTREGISPVDARCALHVTQYHPGACYLVERSWDLEPNRLRFYYLPVAFYLHDLGLGT